MTTTTYYITMDYLTITHNDTTRHHEEQGDEVIHVTCVMFTRYGLLRCTRNDGYVRNDGYMDCFTSFAMTSRWIASLRSQWRVCSQWRMYDRYLVFCECIAFKIVLLSSNVLATSHSLIILVVGSREYVISFFVFTVSVVVSVVLMMFQFDWV